MIQKGLEHWCTKWKWCSHVISFVSLFLSLSLSFLSLFLLRSFRKINSNFPLSDLVVFTLIRDVIFPNVGKSEEMYIELRFNLFVERLTFNISRIAGQGLRSCLRQRQMFYIPLDVDLCWMIEKKDLSKKSCQQSH